MLFFGGRSEGRVIGSIQERFRQDGSHVGVVLDELFHSLEWERDGKLMENHKDVLAEIGLGRSGRGSTLEAAVQVDFIVNLAAQFGVGIIYYLSSKNDTVAFRWEVSFNISGLLFSSDFD